MCGSGCRASPGAPSPPGSGSNAGVLAVERRAFRHGPGGKMRRVVVRADRDSGRRDRGERIERCALIPALILMRGPWFTIGASRGTSRSGAASSCARRLRRRVRPGALWADVGCGSGHLGRALAPLGARVVGLDHDLRMTRYAHRRWSGRFAVVAASSLALRDGSCAGLVAISLFGCLPGRGRTFLAEAARVLAPGGTLCLSAMNRRSLLLAIGKSGARRPGRRHRPVYGVRSGGPHRRPAAGRLRPRAQIFYGHFAGLGGHVLPSPGAAPAARADGPTRPPQRLAATAPPRRTAHRDGGARGTVLLQLVHDAST